MKEVMIALMQNPAGICTIIVMGLAVTTFVAWYGFYLIALPAMSLVSGGKIMLHGLREKTAKVLENEHNSCLTVGPQLGLTLADGGKVVEDDKKE